MGVVYAAFDRIARGAVALKVVHGASPASMPRTVPAGSLRDGEPLAPGDRARRRTSTSPATAGSTRSRSWSTAARSTRGPSSSARCHRPWSRGSARRSPTRSPPRTPRASSARRQAAERDAHARSRRRATCSTSGSPSCAARWCQSDLTEAGAVVGTPQFLAPEQITAPATVGGAGRRLRARHGAYLAAAGRFPFDATAPLAWLHAHAHATPRSLDASRADRAGGRDHELPRQASGGAPDRARARGRAHRRRRRAGAGPLEELDRREDRGADTAPLFAPRE